MDKGAKYGIVALCLATALAYLYDSTTASKNSEKQSEAVAELCGEVVSFIDQGDYDSAKGKLNKAFIIVEDYESTFRNVKANHGLMPILGDSIRNLERKLEEIKPAEE